MGKKLRVRFLKALSGPSGSFAPGDTAEVEERLARAWIEEGACELDKALEQWETKDATRPKGRKPAGKRAGKSRRG